MRRELICGMILGFAGLLPAASPEATNEPYGVCAHISRGKLANAEEEFKRMTEADIGWVRTDFDWDRVEPERGEWTFSHLDRVVELALREKINILPILDYDVAWARPAWKNLDLWGDYVRRTVSRYAKDLRYWEVWNEQNGIGFWRDTPSGTNYAPLLKRAYEEIKKIDPNLTVLYGGTAGVPLPYIEDSLKAGAGKYFDAMNIHPYHWQGVPELMIPELKDLRALLKKYGVGEKPIWITEVGWSTALPPTLYRSILPAVFAKIKIDPSKVDAAIVCDPAAGFPGGIDFDASRQLPVFRKIDVIKLAQLNGLDVQRYPVLIPALGEDFPGAYVPALSDYVRRGGTLLLLSGLPFYYDVQLDGKGGSKRVQVADKFLKTFHIGWETWWTGSGIPRKETYQKPAPEFENAFSIPFKPIGRFLNDRNLAPGDEFIPVVEAGTDHYKGAIAALYKLNSNLKGNVIVCTAMAATETVSEERQAELLPRTFLIALANGVPRIFWYNFRSAEWDPTEREAHFGIVRKDLTPKPAFQAYRTLTELCPSGSTVPELRKTGNVYVADWTRPDGVRTWAVWTAFASERVRLNIKGNVRKVQNHLGEIQAASQTEFLASPSVLYLTGPESVEIGIR